MAQEPQEKGNTGSNFRALIDSGADIAGGAIGRALGFLAAGAGGVAVAAALKKVGDEVSKRFLNPREQVRVGETWRGPKTLAGRRSTERRYYI